MKVLAACHVALCAAALCACFTACALLQAQTGNGSIEGIIKDSSGAVVPGAPVTITRQETSVGFRGRSNETGLYVFPSLPTGHYEIVVSATGMQTWKAELTLLEGQTAEVNPTLQVGASTQIITVEGDVAPLVTTTSGTLGNVLERERVDELPLNGRNFTGLITMTVPGLEGGNTGPSSFIYGLRYATEFQMDGALMQDRYVGNTFVRPPGLDSINELQATTNAASAKVARPGLVTLSTRSGANQIHGSLLETARNNELGLARARTDFYTTPPHLVRNEFGGSFGGPIWIPKVYDGKNKTFFFFNYEARRNFSASTTQIAVPTAAMRQGNFAGLIDSTGHPNIIYDPYSSTPSGSRVPFPNQQIPLTEESPVAKYLFNITPLPTQPGVNPLVAANWFGLAPNNTREYTYSMRLDHHFSDRDQVFVRYTRGENATIAWSSANGDGSPVTLDGQDNVNFTSEHNYTGVFSYTHTFSPTFFSETLANYMYDYSVSQLGPNYNNHSVATSMGLPNPFGGGGLPFLYYMGTSAVSWMSYWTPYATISASRVGTVDQNFTKLKGRHELLFGFRFRQEGLSQLPNQQYAAGYEGFASMATSLLDPNSGTSYSALPYTGNTTANLFLGVATNYTAQFNRSYNRMSAAERTLYFQDDIKVTARLTINAGLRWEYFAPFQANDGGTIGFDPNNLSVVLGAPVSYLIQAQDTTQSLVNGLESLGVTFETTKQAGLPSSTVHNYYKNFGPRAGVAYKLTGANHPLVIRGGASLYAFPEALRTVTTTSRVSIPTIGTFQLAENSSAQSPDGKANYLLRNAPDIIAGVNSLNVVDISNAAAFLTRGNQTVSFQYPNQPTSRAWNWNITFEKEVGLHTMVSAGYVGTHGFNLGQYINTNDHYATSYIWYAETGQPLPTGPYSGVIGNPYYSGTSGPGSVLGNVSGMAKTGWSNMNGIQLQAQHRFSNGIGFQVFYVLANAMRAGGNGWSDEDVEDAAYFLPGAVPADLHASDRLQYYARDTEFPKHRFSYNWIYNLPFGRGKKFVGHVNRALDLAIGGWQLVGNGSIVSTYFTLPTSNWLTGKVQIYGTQYPIQDCRSGTCYRGYLWWNGYIPSTQVNEVNSAGQCIGVCGIPSTYTPADAPLITDPTSRYYNTNTVFLTLQNGSTVSTSFNNAFNPWRYQYAPGPWTYALNGSLWKAFQVHERATLQFHADFFNVLNMPGMPGPSSDGTLLLKNSLNSPRNLQLSLRFVW